MEIKVGDYVKYRDKVYSVARVYQSVSMTRLISYKDLEILENIPKSDLEKLTDLVVNSLRLVGVLPPRRFREGDLVEFRADLDSECVYKASFREMKFKEGKEYTIDGLNELCALSINSCSIHEFEVELVKESEEVVEMFKVRDLVKVTDGKEMLSLKNNDKYVVEGVTRNKIFLINYNKNRVAYTNSNFVLAQKDDTRKMICINNKSNKNPKNDPKYNYRLTVGKSYDVIKHEDNLITVLNDEGVIRYYPDRVFKEKDELMGNIISTTPLIQRMNDVLVSNGFDLKEKWYPPFSDPPFGDNTWDLAWVKKDGVVYTDKYHSAVCHRDMVKGSPLEFHLKEFSEVIEHFTNKSTIQTNSEPSKLLDKKLINLKKEKEMTKLSTIISSNKQAAISSSKIYTGKLCNKKLKSLVITKLPAWIQGYADTPWFDLVLANIVSIGVSNTKLKDNTKTTFVVDGMLQSASLEALESFDIDSMIDSLLSGIKLPSGL